MRALTTETKGVPMATGNSTRRGERLTDDQLREAAAAYATITEFARGNNRAYKQALAAGLIGAIFPVRAVRARITEGEVRCIAAKFRSKTELARGDPSAYNAARRMGVLDSLFSGDRVTWDVEKAIAAASGCTSKTELKKRHYQAYELLSKAGLLDGLLQSKFTSWDMESVRAEASKYRTRSDFAHESGSAYMWALRNGKLSELMPERVDTYGARDAVYIWAADEVSGIYKVGVTSSNRGTYRIRRVASKAGFARSAKVVVLKVVGEEAALKIEAKLKRMGRRHQFSAIFDGCTEFRVMTPEQLRTAIQLIHQH